MKLRLLASALCACALVLLVLAGCGGGDETTSAESDGAAPASIAAIDVDTGPFDSEEAFVEEVNGFCEQAQQVYERTPVYGVSAAGLEAEFTTLLDNEREDLAKTESIEAPDGLADGWAAYNEASSALNDAHEKVLDAAAADDVEKANAILNGEALDATEALRKADDELGTECVDMESDPSTSDGEIAGPAAGADSAPQPANTVDDAAEALLEARRSGDCEELADYAHTQLYLDAETLAEGSGGDCKATAEEFADAEVVATSQWGPVATAAVVTGEGQYHYDNFAIDPDKGGELRPLGRVYADINGLEPPNEGADADATVQAFVDAIRADDPEGLNETVSIETLPASEGGFLQDGDSITKLGDDPDYAKAIVDDIRGDESAEPQLLGIDQLQAAYLLDTAEGNDYLLVLTHQPGSETEYRVNAYWALPTE